MYITLTECGMLSLPGLLFPRLVGKRNVKKMIICRSKNKRSMLGAKIWKFVAHIELHFYWALYVLPFAALLSSRWGPTILASMVQFIIRGEGEAGSFVLRGSLNQVWSFMLGARIARFANSEAFCDLRFPICSRQPILCFPQG